MIDRGEGCYVWDTDGIEYLDGLAGLFCTNLGHGRTDLTARPREADGQARLLPHLGFATPAGHPRPPSMIAEKAPGDLDEVFFVSSGSEAVESALKFARNYHVSQGDDERYKVIAREWAYHGTTLGALAVTGIPKFREHFAADAVGRRPPCPQHATATRSPKAHRPANSSRSRPSRR